MQKRNIIPVFLSRPNPYTYEQQFFLDVLVKKINDYNMSNITLKAKDYNPYESLNCLLEMIKRCYGMIIIAFGQCYIEKGILKKGAQNNSDFFDSRETIVNKKWITSPFCHIEGALAFGNRIPILILEQSNTKIEGILKAGEHAILGPQFNIESVDQVKQYFTQEKFNQSFDEWYSSVQALYEFSNNIEA